MAGEPAVPVAAGVRSWWKGWAWMDLILIYGPTPDGCGLLNGGK